MIDAPLFCCVVWWGRVGGQGEDEADEADEAKASTQDQGGGWNFLGGVYDFDAFWGLGRSNFVV